MSLIPAALLKVYTRLGWTHLSTHPGRTVLTMMGVALGVAATIAVQTANVEVLRSFEESVLTVAGPVTLEVSAGEAGLDERVIRAVREVDGVDSARPVLEVGVTVAAGRRQSFYVLGLDLLDELNRADGRIPAVFETRNRRGEGVAMEGLLRDNGLLVGGALAKDLGVEPG
ncbi:MAG: ABC transporter permease, partial [Nitrospira sp.]|nr:ABC transporter permease [Nitrospira sp.]